METKGDDELFGQEGLAGGNHDGLASCDDDCSEPPRTKNTTSEWQAFPKDLLLYIVNGFCNFEDVLKIRGICPQWRKAVSLKEVTLPEDQKPWMYLKEEEPGCFKFLSMEKKCFYRLYFPECAGSRLIATEGWLIFLPPEGKIKLLHPFGNRSYEMPSPVALKKHLMWEQQRNYDGYIWRAVLCPTRMEVAVIQGYERELAFWKVGDERFCSGPINLDDGFLDVAQCGSKFFGLDRSYEVSVFDSESFLRKFQLLGIGRGVRGQYPCGYLVAFSGDLFVLQRNRNSVSLRAVSLDSSSDVQVGRVLGQMASFYVGQSSSFAIKGSTLEICFTDDCRVHDGWTQAGLYNCLSRNLENEGWVEIVEGVRGGGRCTNAQWLMPGWY